MLPWEHAIKWWFVIPPLLTNVFALPGETWTPGNCIFSVMLYTVSLQKFPEHAVDFVFLSVEKVFTVASPVNLQKNRVYTRRAMRRSATSLLNACCRPTFFSSLMVSVAVSKLGWTELFFVQPAAKVDRRYWDDECRRYNKQKECGFRDILQTERHNFWGSFSPAGSADIS